MKKQAFDCGGRLRQLRKKYHFSQEQLALKADVTPSYISQLERGLKNPTVLMVEMLCDAMGCSLLEFFGGVDCQAMPAEEDSFHVELNQFFQNKTYSERKKYLNMLTYLEEFYNNLC